MLTEQDKVNIDFAYEWLQKAKKKGRPKWGRLEAGIIPWVGKVGYRGCVSALAGKRGITDAKALCGALKREARKRGVLKKEHMGRKERAAARKRAKK